MELKEQENVEKFIDYYQSLGKTHLNILIITQIGAMK